MPPRLGGGQLSRRAGASCEKGKQQNSRKFFKEQNARNVFPTPKTRSETESDAIMSGKAHPPELKKFMDKRVHLKINGNRAVEGILRGFDPFMNLVLDETIEFTKVKLESLTFI